jgi:hypothetical protein
MANFYDYKKLIDKCNKPFNLHNISVMLDGDFSINDYDRVCINRLIKFRREYLKECADKKEKRC